MSPPGSTSPESCGAQEFPVEGPIRLGSDAHKTFFCRAAHEPLRSAFAATLRRSGPGGIGAPFHGS